MTPIPVTILPLVWALMSQASGKIYDEFRQWVGQVPPLNQEQIFGQLSDSMSFIELPASADDVQCVTGFLASVDFQNDAVDAMTFYLLGQDPSTSTHLRRTTRQHLLIHGVTAPAAEIIAEIVLTHIASAARVIAPRTPEELFNLRAANSEESAVREDESIRAARRRMEDQAAAALAKAKSDMSRKIIDALAEISDILEGDVVAASSVQSKLAALRKASRRYHETISPPNFQSVRRVPLEEIYVAPDLRYRSGPQVSAHEVDHEGEKYGLNFRVKPRSETVEPTRPAPNFYAPIFRECRRVVILGTPGAGKSTLAQHLTLLCNSGTALAGAEASIIVVLREMSEYISDRGLSVLAAVAAVARERYQIAFTAAEMAYLCSSGRLLVIFDGLDEILKLSQRESVVGSVEAFSAIYERSPLVITAREVGYDLAPLNPRYFRTSVIAPFDPIRIERYAGKWFRLDSEIGLPAQEALTHSFLEESAAIRDLCENPLLLSLLCGLYKTQEHLPRNRPQIYEACSLLLFKAWDDKRGLYPRFEFDAHVDGAVQHLASWIFASQARTAGVPESELVAKTADYLDEWQYNNRRLAERAARQLVEHCRGRAWILTDVGGGEDHELRYGFTHRTFLEYFTARHLKANLDEAAIVDLISEHAADAEWNMVCQMLIQLSPEKRAGLEDRILEAVTVSLPPRSPNERALALTLCAQSLRNLPFRPQTAEAAATVLLNVYLSQHRRQIITSDASSLRVEWLGASNIAVENQRSVSRVARKILSTRLLNESYTAFYTAHAADLVLATPHLLFAPEGLLTENAKERIRANLSSSLGARVCTAAALLGVDVADYLSTASNADRMHVVLGNAVRDTSGSRLPHGGPRVRPLENGPGLRRIPGLVEMLAVCAVSRPLAASIFSQTWEKIGAQSENLLRGRSVLDYEPHQILWRTSDSTTLELEPARGYEAEMIYAFWIRLCEAYIGLADSEQRAARMLDVNWGRMLGIRQALCQRYSLAMPAMNIERRREHVRALAEAPQFVRDWAQGEKASTMFAHY